MKGGGRRGKPRLIGCLAGGSHTGSHRGTRRGFHLQPGQLGEEHSILWGGTSPRRAEPPCDARDAGSSAAAYKEAVTQCPPLLSHARHARARTHARTTPTQVPGPERSSCQAQSLVASTQLSPPASSLPTHPGQNPRVDEGDAFHQRPRKIPSPLRRQVTGLPPGPPLQEDKEGLGGLEV